MTLKKSLIAAFVTVICITGCGKITWDDNVPTDNEVSTTATSTSEHTTANSTTVNTTATTKKDRKITTLPKKTTTTTETSTAIITNITENNSDICESENKVSEIANTDKTSSGLQENTSVPRQLNVTSVKTDRKETTTVSTLTPTNSNTTDSTAIPTTTITETTKIVHQGNGNVLLIAEFADQMGKQPLRISDEESEMLINMFNEIELEPVDKPVPPDDPMNQVYGGGYIMYIEGGDKIVIRGNRNVMINDKFYYDLNDKSDALSGKIGDVLYSYFGSP